ncbi:NUDIX domain-containing protein [Polycladidibacter stylochi]|uniref:NUDIX domain-containing protein n=1 Tax=Polycladidibacter stylochi TaxID=1807766 RepID=UPI000836501B|nr:NUDIX domain-containing protein [Pseudovibrio stylochi]
MHCSPDSLLQPAGVPIRRKRFGVSIACLDRFERVLLIKRAHEPDAGLWAFPGGKCERGESFYQAGQRELYEESGLRAGMLQELEELQFLTDLEPGGQQSARSSLLTLRVFYCLNFTGEAKAASDADDCKWISLKTIIDDEQVRELEKEGVVLVGAIRNCAHKLHRVLTCI